MMMMMIMMLLRCLLLTLVNWTWRSKTALDLLEQTIMIRRFRHVLSHAIRFDTFRSMRHRAEHGAGTWFFFFSPTRDRRVPRLVDPRTLVVRRDRSPVP